MAPDLDFRGQPYGEEDTAGAFLHRVVGDDQLTSLTFVTAWARLGGIARLHEALERFRDRGGHTRAIVGIDEGIATRPGLEALLAVTDEAFVFHDPTGRTFHPKLYLAEGSTSASLLVGSSNATAGGLWFNYEASIEARFFLPEDAEQPALLKARRYIETLIADEGLRRPLDHELLEELAAHPDFEIAVSERRARGRGDLQVEGTGQEELDQGGSASLEDMGRLFGTSRFTKATVPSLPARARTELPQADAPVTEAVVDYRWTKQLSPTDAQHPPTTASNPTGNLRLTKAGNEIDWLTWFRRVLFGPAVWERRKDRQGNPTETARVTFLVRLGNETLGNQELVVDHAPHRESGQSNHATVLHWGILRQRLEQRDFTGHVLALERLSDGTYRMTLD